MATADGGEARLRCMAASAKLAARRCRKSVRLVARGARLSSRVRAVVRRGNRSMARCARARFDRRIAAVWDVAIDARLRAGVDGGYFPVATNTGARGLGGRVRRVTVGAVGVTLHDGAHQCRLGAVTPDADTRPPRDEVVRLVTGQAAVVTGGFGSSGVLVARGTGLQRRLGRRVGSMAVETALAAGMGGVLGRALVVAALARRWLERRRLVGVMAIVARGGAVLNERCELPLRLAMAIDTRWSRSRCERMAREAFGLRGAAGVGKSCLLLMAATAHRNAGIGEPGALRIVTVIAHDGTVADVLLVAGAGSILSPRCGHRDRNHFRRSPGKHAKKTRHAGGDEHQDCGQGGENRPTSRTHCVPPWQSRQGRSVSLSRVLEKPRPWGLPPGPPTR
jgi:hypothetical protein